jgi:hypothetical protein
VLRRDEIRNERGGCDPTGASEEAGRFAHDPLQAAPLLMGDDDAEGADVRACFVGLVGLQHLTKLRRVDLPLPIRSQCIRIQRDPRITACAPAGDTLPAVTQGVGRTTTTAVLSVSI